MEKNELVCPSSNYGIWERLEFVNYKKIGDSQGLKDKE